MGYLEVNKSVKKKVYYAPCIECGSDDIDFINYGYSTFNCGEVRCSNCGNSVELKYISTSASKTSMIPDWNAKNDPKILIGNLEKHIESCQKKLEHYKSKLK